jgi:hypothetical protein
MAAAVPPNTTGIAGRDDVQMGFEHAAQRERSRQPERDSYRGEPLRSKYPNALIRKATTESRGTGPIARYIGM